MADREDLNEPAEGAGDKNNQGGSKSSKTSSAFDRSADERGNDVSRANSKFSRVPLEKHPGKIAPEASPRDGPPDLPPQSTAEKLRITPIYNPGTRCRDGLSEFDQMVGSRLADGVGSVAGGITIAGDYAFRVVQAVRTGQAVAPSPTIGAGVANTVSRALEGYGPTIVREIRCSGREFLGITDAHPRGEGYKLEPDKRY